MNGPDKVDIGDVIDINNPTDEQKRVLLAGYEQYKSLTCPIKRMLAMFEAGQYLKTGIMPESWAAFLDKVPLSDWDRRRERT